MAEYNTLLGFKIDLKQLENLEKQLEAIQTQLEKVSTEFKDVAKDANKASGDMSSGFSKLSNLIKGAGIVYGLMKIGQGLGYIAKQSMDAEREMASLESVIRSTGGVAGFTAQEIDKLSTHLSRSSIFSAGEINDAAARLLTYTDIVGEEVPRAMQNIIDWSARYNVSLVQAAETVGKAIQKPSAAAAALSRQGFKFTDEFIKKLQELERAGKLAEAQSLMFEEIEEGTKGAAEAMRNTLGGAITGLQNSLDDLVTGDSGSFKGASQAINDLTSLLNDQSTKDAFNVLIEGFAKVAEWATKATVAITEFFAKSNNGLQVGFNSLVGRAIGYNTNSTDYKQILSDIADAERVITAIEEKRSGSGMRNLAARKAELEALKRQKSYLESIGLTGSGGVRQTYTPPAGLAGISAANTGSSAGSMSKEQQSEIERSRKEYERILERFKQAVVDIKNQGVIDTLNQSFLENNNFIEGGALQRVFTGAAAAAEKLGVTITGAVGNAKEMSVELQYNLDAYAEANNLTAARKAELEKILPLVIKEAQINERGKIIDEAKTKLAREKAAGERELADIVAENEIRANNLLTRETEINRLIKDSAFQRQLQAQYEENLAKYGEEYAQQIRDQNAALYEQTATQEGIAERIAEQRDLAESFKTNIVDTIGKAFDQMWEGQSVKFGDLLRDLAKQLIRSMVFNYLMQGLSGGGWSMNIGTTTFAANGGVFDKGVKKFANGGIVNRATPFGMANGGLGVMGEAGPEAILPLTRGANGKLGVQTNGSSGPTVVIGAGAVVVNATNDSNADAEATAQAIKALIDTRVNQILKDSMRTGNMLNRTRSGNY